MTVKIGEDQQQVSHIGIYLIKINEPKELLIIFTFLQLGYCLVSKDRNFAVRQVEESNTPRESIAWYIPNSPPLPNDNDNYRRYCRGLEREPEIEMMLIDHQQQARRGQGRARVVPQSRVMVNGHSRVRIRIHNLEAPVHGKNEVGIPRWSLFQVWNNLAYITCSVPSRIAWEDHRGMYIVKYSRVQQAFFGVQQILSTVEIISWWRQFADVFLNESSPLKYVQFGSLALYVSTRVCYMTTTIFGIGDLLKVHTYAVNSGAATGYQIKMGKIMTITTFVGYSAYLSGFLVLEMALYTYNDLGSWDWGLAEFIQSFACYARQVFTWATEDDCPDDIFFALKMLPRKEVLYGCLGILTYVSGLFIEIHTTLMIMSSCMSLLSETHSLTNADNHVLPTQRAIGDANESDDKPPRPLAKRYEFLEQFSGKISTFVGIIFMVAIGLLGLSLPNVLDNVFNNYEMSTLPAIIRIVVMLLLSLVACVAAMQIDALEDQLTKMDNIEQLPHDIRRLIIYLHRLFRRSPGIGYRGLFVMNFVYLITYCGAVAGLVAFTYDAKKKES